MKRMPITSSLQGFSYGQFLGLEITESKLGGQQDPAEMEGEPEDLAQKFKATSL
jgi:hypothetical protein